MKDKIEEKDLRILLKKYHDTKNSGTRNRIFNHTMWLADFLAGKASVKYNMPRDDLFQEASLGLMRAIDKFDLSYTNKFSTYAAWWIKKMISEHVKKTNKHGICHGMDDFTLDEDSSTDDLPFMKDDSNNPEQEFSQLEYNEKIEKLLIDALNAIEINDRDRDIFHRRHILDKPHTLAEIGRDYGISTTYVRDRDLLVLDKLKKIMIKMDRHDNILSEIISNVDIE